MAHRKLYPAGAPLGVAAVLYFDAAFKATKHNFVPAVRTFTKP